MIHKDVPPEHAGYPQGLVWTLRKDCGVTCSGLKWRGGGLTQISCTEFRVQRVGGSCTSQEQRGFRAQKILPSQSEGR